MTAEELEKQLKADGFFGKNCYWISCSLAAGFFMGTGAAIFATHYADLGFEGGGLSGPIVFVIFFLLWIIRVLVFRCKKGRWTNEGEDSRLIWANGKTKWSNLVPLLGNATVNVSYLIVMTYAWYFAELSGMN